MAEVFKRQFLELSVVETDEGRGFWLDKPWVPEAARTDLVSAALVAVPNDRGDEAPTFPTGTSEFVERLRDLLEAEHVVGVAISSDDYQELALHSKAWRWPTLILSAVVAPIVVNILSDRLDELIPGHKDGDTAEATFIIESPNHRALKVTYKGDPKEIGKLLGEVIPKYIAAIDDDTHDRPVADSKSITPPKP